MHRAVNVNFRSYSRTTLQLTAPLLLIAAVGCGRSREPQYDLNMVEFKTTLNVLPAEEQQDYLPQINDALTALFGTPDDPYVLPQTGLDERKIELAAGPVWSDHESGEQGGLYRQHCVHCHGITGDGMGPTAPFLNPYPRDYRPGVFKGQEHRTFGQTGAIRS